MQTPADEHLTKASLAVQVALNNLSEVVVKRVEGSSEYLPDFNDRLEAAFYDLMRVRKVFDEEEYEEAEGDERDQETDGLRSADI